MAANSFAWQVATMLFLTCVVSGCSPDPAPPPTMKSLKSSQVESVQKMNLTSSSLVQGETIDSKYTADGQDVSPALAWSDVPAETKSFALICDDPDAPSAKRPAPEPWVHWIIFNIPGDRSELPAAVSRQSAPSEVQGSRQGKNSWPNENIGYRGPAPPPGSGPHRYFFKLYALDTVLNLEAGATKQQLLDAMSGHVLAEGTLMGVYER